MARPINKPGKRRRVRPRVCATCKYFLHTGEGSSVCQRDPERVCWDTSSGEFWFEVCNNWKEPK